MIKIKPQYAGRFYTDNKQELESEIKLFFDNAKPRENDATAVISPHAGYVFSGQIAADAINQINPQKEYDNIFVISSSHSSRFKGAAVLTSGSYQTILGDIEVNTNLCNKLVSSNNLFSDNIEAIQNEHSLEVQLPLLKHHLKKDFKLVPILLGQVSADEITIIANTLDEYFNENNAFIISSDFSHYPEYSDAIEVDKRTAEAICENNIEVFKSVIKSNKALPINSLDTDLCGKSSVLCLLELTKNKDYKYNIINYKNSGDSVYGSKDSVVGYYAISIVNKNSDSLSLNKNQKEYLLNLSKKSLVSFINSGEKVKIDEKTIENDTNLSKKCGIFVTLRKNAKLRGCLGRFMSDKTIPETVIEMTIASATQDYRFGKVTADELNDISIEISILTPMQKIESISEIIPGKHGIYIKKGEQSGTFLPEVAKEQNWGVTEMLEICSEQKAGIGKDGWKDAEIFIYESIKVSDK